MNKIFLILLTLLCFCNRPSQLKYKCTLEYWQGGRIINIVVEYQYTESGHCFIWEKEGVYIKLIKEERI